MDVIVYTNGEQYYYDSNLRKIISRGNLEEMFGQKDANIKVVDMSLYKEQSRSYQNDPDYPVFEQDLYVPYNPLEVEKANDRIFTSDGAVKGGGMDSNFEFDYEKVRYVWPQRDIVLNEVLRELYKDGVPVNNRIVDIDFSLNIKEDTDFPTIEVMDNDKSFSHLVRIAKGKYNFHVRFTPNLLGNKHNYNSEGAIKRCNDMKVTCSRDKYQTLVKSWSDRSKVFSLAFNDDLQIDFVTVINTTNSLNNTPGSSRISSSSRHLSEKSLDFDDMLDYVNTYSNNTRVGRRR